MSRIVQICEGNNSGIYNMVGNYIFDTNCLLSNCVCQEKEDIKSSNNMRHASGNHSAMEGYRGRYLL